MDKDIGKGEGTYRTSVRRIKPNVSINSQIPHIIAEILENRVKHKQTQQPHHQHWQHPPHSETAPHPARSAIYQLPCVVWIVYPPRPRKSSEARRMLAQDWGRGLMLSEFELGLKVDVLPGLSGEETKLRELSE